MRLRWFALGVFVLSSALNYLDRQVLPALAPAIQGDLKLSNQDYGLVLSAFSIAYAFSAPFAGLLIDRIGLNRGISLAVGLWALAGAATGFTASLAGLIAARAALGVAQAGGVPAVGKAIAAYLKPEERALGHALSQIGLGVGAFAAPPLAVWLADARGWRSAFIVTGLATLAWIPLWNWIASRVPHAPLKPSPKGSGAGAILRDSSIWGLIAANVLIMTVYTLWSNWTTVYVVREFGLKIEETKWLAAVPPIFFNLGGLAGGWLSLRLMRQGRAAVASRLKVCLAGALLLLLTATVPLMPAPGWAIAAISFSAFCVSAMSVNLYSIPLDLYGAARAAFAVSMLTSAYGAMQSVFSPVAGRMVDRWGFEPVCLMVALLPLAGYAVLRYTAGRERAAASDPM